MDRAFSGRPAFAAKLLPPVARQTAPFRLLYEPPSHAPLSTLQTCLGDLKSSPSSQTTEQESSAPPDSDEWARRISQAIVEGEEPRARQAIALYESALSSGVYPTGEMLYPILKALCRAQPRAPTDEEINTALELFRRFLDNIGSARPAIELYNTLLRALTSSPNTTKYHPVARSLIQDIQHRNIAMDAMTTTSMVIMMMRGAPTFSAAYSVYGLLCRSPKSKFELDEEGYLAVLSALCRLAESEGAPRPQIWYEVLNDMRMAGHTISAKAYTVFLQQLGYAATRLRDADRQTRIQLVEIIKAIRQFIAVDPSIQPDTILWNQLMDTWQRAGCAEEAFQVWEHLLVARQYNHASVSIILDTCGYLGAVPVAADILAKVRKDGFRLNLNNWNSWLECLCRAGKIDEALRVLCLEMSSKGVQPDAETARTVLKFAFKVGELSKARRQISRFLPHLWQQLPISLRTDTRP